MAAAFMFFYSCMKIGCLAMAVLIVGCIVFSPAQVTDFDLPSRGTRAYENVLREMALCLGIESFWGSESQYRDCIFDQEEAVSLEAPLAGA